MESKNYSKENKMNICIVAGARPNFIKVAPILQVAKNIKSIGKDVSLSLVYTGSESDTTLEASLFHDLQIAPPDYYLGVESNRLNEITSQVMSKFDYYLQYHKTDIVIVVDDLASTMAAAIVSKKQGLTLVHLAAGTRSFDISMPKEINRLVIDGLSDILFTAGISNNAVTNREGTEQSKVYMVGNILIDNIRNNQSRFTRPNILNELAIQDNKYLTFTINRKALLANKSNLQKMLMALVNASHEIPIIAPLRNEAKTIVEELLPSGSNNFHITSPMSYLDFSYLASHSKGIITDSGSVAEEATFNMVPCITLNSYTEHIETVKIGSNVLVGEDAQKLTEYISAMSQGNWKKHTIPERWDGRSAERIFKILLQCNAAR